MTHGRVRRGRVIRAAGDESGDSPEGVRCCFLGQLYLLYKHCEKHVTDAGFPAGLSGLVAYVLLHVTCQHKDAFPLVSRLSTTCAQDVCQHTNQTHPIPRSMCTMCRPQRI
jgi:hypothetical protein